MRVYVELIKDCKGHSFGSQTSVYNVFHFCRITNFVLSSVIWWPCCGSRACHNGNLVSIAGQPLLDLLWTR